MIALDNEWDSTPSTSTKRSQVDAREKNVIIHSEMKPMKISQPNWNDVRNSP